MIDLRQVSPRLALIAGGAAVLAGVVFLAGLLLGDAGIVEKVKNRLSPSNEPRMFRELADAETFNYKLHQTALEGADAVSIPIGQFIGSGGALTSLDNHVIFVTSKGIVGSLEAEGDNFKIAYTEARVPKNYVDLIESELGANPMMPLWAFRVSGALVVDNSVGGKDLLVSHHRYTNECIEFVVSRIGVAADASGLVIDTDGGWDDVFVAEPCLQPKDRGLLFGGLQAGGKMALAPDGKLLLTVGDHELDGINSDTPAPALLDNDYGKLIEIDLETKEHDIFAYGLRNPQGLVVTQDGSIWDTEHGPKGGDEINKLVRGGDYGWPSVTYGVLYGFPTRPWPPNAEQGRHEAGIKPIFSFVPSVATADLIEASGDQFPLWRGDLLLSTLINQTLWRLRPEDDRIVYAEPMIDFGEKLRDIELMADGRYAILSDSGNIIVLRRHDESAPSQTTVTGYREAIKAAEAMRAIEWRNRVPNEQIGEALYVQHCASCHSINGEEGAGPHLRGLIGRDIASVEGYAYSEALANYEGVWTKRLLTQYLSDPDARFEGTTMPYIFLTHGQYDRIAEYLETQ